jgi:hypothetical protein
LILIPKPKLVRSKVLPRIATGVAWMFGVALVYILVAAPVLKMTLRMWTAPAQPPVVMRAFYTPVGWLYGHTPLRKPIGMYNHLWLPELFDVRGEFIFVQIDDRNIEP